jgi:hypothetical protein
MTAPGIEVIIPIKTVNESNGQHGHWRTKSSRRKAQREAVAWALHKSALPPLPVRITLTRISAGQLDAHDNLRGALKSIADEVAELYGLPDRDDRFIWHYAQERCKRGEFGVRIRIEPADER